MRHIIVAYFANVCDVDVLEVSQKICHKACHTMPVVSLHGFRLRSSLYYMHIRVSWILLKGEILQNVSMTYFTMTIVHDGYESLNNYRNTLQCDTMSAALLSETSCDMRLATSQRYGKYMHPIKLVTSMETGLQNWYSELGPKHH